ncbi:MAG: phosphate acyltransferase PlsX [Clostridiales bacterium]|nr:phosphate acyltransferase PlsX [Clostridiales bacterium]
MKIILDGMGGDNAPEAIVEGAALASRLINHDIIIAGDEKQILEELSKHKSDHRRISVTHASETITSDDAPVKAVRSKKDSSMVVGLNMLKEGKGDVFISGGNTGALMAGGLFILGRVQGIDRPAIASVYPIMGQGVSLLVDAGANAECKPNNLLEFATMGSIYMEKVLKIKSPTVGLVNIGTEEGKGTTVIKAAHELLAKSDLNFIGNVEAREIPKGACDVIVCDGFVGNVILKLTEGLAWNIFKLIRAKFTKGTAAKMGAVLLGGKLKELRKEVDYSEYGGAPILGLKRPIVKMHGSSGANGVKNTILKAIPFAEENVVSKIQNSVVEIEEILISEQL